MKLTYVTGNYGKYYAMKRRLKNQNIDIEWAQLELSEPEIDYVAVVSKEKARQAYNTLKKPCFVMDSGFYIEAYPEKPGYPGAMVKRSGIAYNVEALLKTMEGVENRSCKFVDCLTFYDGKIFSQFFHESPGMLSHEIRGTLRETAQSRLWLVFILEGYDITIAQMSEKERLAMDDGRISSVEKFVKWYKEKCV